MQPLLVAIEFSLAATMHYSDDTHLPLRRILAALLLFRVLVLALLPWLAVNVIYVIASRSDLWQVANYVACDSGWQFFYRSRGEEASIVFDSELGGGLRHKHDAYSSQSLIVGCLQTPTLTPINNSKYFIRRC